MADLNRDLFNQLARFAMGPIPGGRKTSDYDIALEILKNSRGSVNLGTAWNPAFGGPSAKPKEKDDGPGVFGRIIDIISRPLYAAATGSKYIDKYNKEHPEDSFLGRLGNYPGAVVAGLKGNVKGFTGKEKNTYSRLLNESGYLPENPYGRFAVGLSADVIGDPLLLTPIGGIGKAGIRGAARALGKEAPYIALPRATKQAIKRARLGTPKPENFAQSPIVPANQAPSAFNYLTREAAESAGTPSPATPGFSGAPLPYTPTTPLPASGLARDLFGPMGSPSGAVENLEPIRRFNPRLNRPAAEAGTPSPASVAPTPSTPLPPITIPTSMSNVDVAQNAFNQIERHVDDLWNRQGHVWEVDPRTGAQSLRVNSNAARVPGLNAARVESVNEARRLITEAGGITSANADRIIELMSNVNIRGQISGRAVLGEITGNPALIASSAVRDAGVVSTAIEQGTREAAIAENALSAQQAAVHAANTTEDGRTVLQAANASPAAIKTYGNLMQAITYKARGPVQNAIDRNAGRIAVAITPATQKTFRSSRGRFLPKGTLLPTVGKVGTTANPGRTDAAKNIFSLDKIRQAQKSIIETPAPRTASRNPEVTRTGFRPNVAPRPRAEIAPKGVFGPVNTAVSHAIQASAHIPVTKLKPGETISEQDVTRGLMARVATWVGQKDLRPLVLDNMTSALARAGQLQQAMERAFKGFSEDQALEAWDLARNAKPHGLASSPEVSRLGDMLRGQMEQFFRSRAVPERLARGNSAAMRAGITMQDINKTLGRYDIPFRFTNKVATDPITHNPISYEQGTNWLISWEGHAPRNATELKKFLFGLQSAAHQTLGQYAFLDDVAYRMGSIGKTAIQNVKVAHPRLVDYYFDKDVADQLSTALRTMDDFYNPKSAAARFVRSAVSMWKTGVTIYNPRHHIANAIGDSFLMWQSGINDPRVFSKAAKVLFANAGHYKDLASVDQLIGTNAVKNALAKPGTAVAKNKSGVSLTAQQAYIAAFNGGLLQKAMAVEDLAKSVMPFKPFGGKVHGFAAGAAESREHYIKLAHFIGAFEKSRGKNIPQILEEVTHEVRKWHPDGLDLTKQEQAVRSLIVPFYSWMRKSTPLIIEGALMRPQKAFTAYAKVNYNLQQSLGIEGTSLSNPYPDDQLFPSWLKDDNTPVIGKTGMPGLGGFLAGLTRQGKDDEGNPLDSYTLGMPTNPVQDFFTQFGGFRNFSETKDAMLSTINPMARIPLELQQGRELYTQIPLENRHTDYITNQIPMVNQVARMTNVGPFGPTGRAEKYGYGNKEAALNWAFGVNLMGTGPYIKSAEFERLPKKREENERIREFSSDIGYPLKDKGRIPEWIRELYYQRNGGQ